MPYALQLLHKRNTVKLAYSRFSDLKAAVVPEIQPTIGSPKQWGYRTKITPHFDAPPKSARTQLEREDAAARTEVGEEEGMNADVQANGNGHSAEDDEKRSWECRIGFERKGRPGVMDIEVGRDVHISCRVPEGQLAERPGMPHRHTRHQRKTGRRAQTCQRVSDKYRPQETAD